MKLDLHLTEEEVNSLKSGGFIKMLLEGGLIITIEMEDKDE